MYLRERESVWVGGKEYERGEKGENPTIQLIFVTLPKTPVHSTQCTVYKAEIITLTENILQALCSINDVGH